MKKYISFVSIIFSILISAAPILARAHEEEQAQIGNTTINATLHIDPSDHPVVGQLSKFYISFNGGDEVLAANSCKCSVELRKGEEVLTKKVIAISQPGWLDFSTTPIVEYAFASAGEYVLVVQGAPKEASSFVQFELRFPFMVDDNAHMHMTTEHHTFVGQHLGHVIIFGSGFGFIIGYLIYSEIKKRKELKNGQ
jgi:hypothetical protein